MRSRNSEACLSEAIKHVVQILVVVTIGTLVSVTQRSSLHAADGQEFFSDALLRNLRNDNGTIAVPDLLKIDKKEVRFICAAGPYGTFLPYLSRYAKDAVELEQLADFVQKHLSIGPSESYLMAVTNKGPAILSFGRWRISILDQSEYFCSEDIQSKVKYRAIGYLWLNRFNR